MPAVLRFPRECPVCDGLGCEFCPSVALVHKRRCFTCGETIEPGLERLGSINCSKHRRVYTLITAYSDAR